MSTYKELLSEWYAKEKAEGRILDLKFFPDNLSDRFELTEAELEAKCKAVFEVLTGIVPSREMTDEELAKL